MYLELYMYIIYVIHIFIYSYIFIHYNIFKIVSGQFNVINMIILKKVATKRGKSSQ